MKKILLALVIIGAIGAAVYLVNNAASPAAVDAPAKTAEKAAVEAPRVAAVAPKPQAVLPPATSSKPVAQVAAKTAALVASAPRPVAEKTTPPSPRAELATMIPELARLIDIQDYATLMQDFMPPEELAALLANVGRPGQPMALEDLASRMRQDPNTTQRMAGASQFLSYLQTQTPTFDATGESASYKMPVPVNGQDSINFVKVDGNWYVKNGVQFFR